MALFWDRGFQATGVADLEAVMGINKFSLYAAFGSKRGLLQETLDLYARTWQASTFQMLDPCEPGPSILRLFEFATHLQERIGHNGCFLLSLGQEFNHADPDIMGRIEALYTSLESRLAECVARLDRTSPLGAGDPASGAVFLRTHLEGILSRSRHGGGIEGGTGLEVLRRLLEA